MKDYEEIRNTAVTSAERYYEYLDQHGKGVIETSVLDISILKDGFVRLKLYGKLLSLDGVRIKLVNRVYSIDEIMPAHYDNDENILLVRPRDELRHLFTSTPPHHVKVISDLKFLVKRVRDWYAFRAEPLSLPDVLPCISPDMPELIAQPSEEQSTAFCGIFRSPLIFIWGAPGTGKTQFVLARAVLAYCQAGKRVLIAAPTNNAVEQTLKGVLAVLNEAGIPFERVLRLGTPSKEFYDQYPMVCEVRAVEDELETLEEQIAFYQKCLNFYSAFHWLEQAEEVFFLNSQKLHKLLNELSALAKKIDDLESNLNVKQALVAPIITEVNILAAKKKKLTDYINKGRSPFSDWLHKSAIERSKVELASVDQTLQRHAAEHEQLLNECGKLKQQISDMRGRRVVASLELSNACRAIREIPPSPFYKDFTRITSAFYPDGDINQCILTGSNALGKARNTIDSRAERYSRVSFAKASAELESLNKRKNELDQSSVASRLSECYVVAATVDGCISRLPKDAFSPVHVFLDEAAYCPLIKGATLLSYDAPLTLLGDHMQLPPVCEMPDGMFQSEFNMPVCLWAQSTLYLCDLFEKSLGEIFYDYQNEIPPQFNRLAKYDLLHTYRFGESLARVLARFVYTHEFQGNSDITTDIVILDVPKNSADPKHTNLGECMAIKQFLRENFISDYAILAPFRKQRALLAKSFPQDTVFTIHGSQGREWDTVFLSVTVTSTNWFLKPRLINTAVSRTKGRLIVVCDTSYWSTREDHIIGGIVSAGVSAK